MSTAPEARYPWGSAVGSQQIGWARRITSWVLLGVAGSTDAIGFLLFAGLYVSFMSGDATQTGVTLGHGNLPRLVEILGAQALFVLGAALGQVVQNVTGTRRRVVLLAGVTVLLAVSAVSGSSVPALAFVCAVTAMGAQNSVMHQEAGTPVGTMITGTLVRLGEGIVEALRGRPGAVTDNLGQWVAFAVGAAIGTLTWTAVGPAAFALPAVGALAVCLVLAARGRHHRPQAAA